MSSRKQTRANRQNAKRSTGPKTPEGKAASSANSTVHGLSSAFRVLPHEDAEAYARSIDELAAEFQPATSHQRFLVEQMAQSRWRLDRTRRYETLALEQLIGSSDEANPEARIVEAMSNRVNNIFDLLRRYANDAERSYYKAHAALAKEIALRNEATYDAMSNKWMGRLQDAQRPFDPGMMSDEFVTHGVRMSSPTPENRR
ncbi:MAG: hypothetical protein JSU00_19710 [Acidobacteria bacterium]|nr:hypothetical protein [Acidobacteriota bacterium]